MRLALGLQVADAEKEMQFLQAAFNAAHRLRHHRPDGSVGHCEVSACRSDVSSTRQSARSPMTITGKDSITSIHLFSLLALWPSKCSQAIQALPR